MKILALDLGTRTGWALLEDGHVESGVQVFDVKRGESPGMRYLRFNRWLEEMASADPRPDVIVFEQAHHRGGAATEVAAGFSTRVLEFCARHGIEHASVHTATLKKFATGKGNADKEAMLGAARERFKPNLADDNEADALWILEYASNEILPHLTKEAENKSLSSELVIG
jgi:crossover junction endodeoxyribonuclease RuvC